MKLDNEIKLFEGNQIRSIWDSEKEEWYFSVVDILGILTESGNPRKYWSVLKTRLKQEGNELATICSQLKLKSPKDGKMYNTDVSDMQGIFRIIHLHQMVSKTFFKVFGHFFIEKSSLAC